MNKPILKLHILSHTRSVFGWLIILLSFGLLSLPLITTFNDLLTSLFLHLKAYRIIAEVVVPAQVKWVVVILRFFGLEAQSAGEYIIIRKLGQDLMVELIWNCIGWQSLLMFIFTA